MNPILKNILAVIAGWLGGSIINIALIKIGHKLIPIKGIDPNDMDALAAVMPSLGFEYFIFPFLAHALGTLAGATIAGLIAASHKMKFSLGIGGLFLLGGIMVNYMLPGPTWFAVADIAIAYIPMAWIGGKIAMKISENKKRGE
ncbi:hypothetical protein IWQ47_003877 [Aquimarina sp. EL_43]|uniref:hypothetical protein n=1 Tax=unclassified Aquimarina TaxID=2627091 RepID=UPI0018CBB6AE|nr:MULTISPECIES: hypothetical protein [unclassified Aquimarina]MBG6132652.1 hypothetical protein [Aquimarina sp. EL_35]MBG6152783.1 hypothetical protein [Aquimarina sp. EL_32]MBG6170790.1 hypothetical protein [Aquimarina sp. EL_43]